MDTPQNEFDTIINEFNEALSRLGPGMGDPVTRAERALIKTFYIFLTQREHAERTASDDPQEKDPQLPQ